MRTLQDGVYALCGIICAITFLGGCTTAILARRFAAGLVPAFIVPFAIWATLIVSRRHWLTRHNVDHFGPLAEVVVVGLFGAVGGVVAWYLGAWLGRRISQRLSTTLSGQEDVR